jgi:hypothetical protein
MYEGLLHVRWPDTRATPLHPLLARQYVKGEQA